MASLSIENHEKTLKTTFDEFAELNFARAVEYGYGREAEGKSPYILIYPITWAPTGLAQAVYCDQVLPKKDLIEQLVLPVDISFTILFGGGNARGELAICILNLRKNSDITDHMLTNGMAYQRASGGVDISGQIGAQNEQRAQTDVFFSAIIAPEERIIPSIQEVSGSGEIKNSSDEKILDVQFKTEI